MPVPLTLGSVFIHHFPLGQILDQSMVWLELFGWDLEMLAGSFEDRGGVLA